MNDFYIILFLFGMLSYVLPLALAIAIILGYIFDKKGGKDV